MKNLLGAHLLLVLFLALGSQRPQAPACATARVKGERVHVASESALIVWDDKTKMQHFIRRASFKTTVPYFGFLVPTPTLPALSEAPDAVFQSLEDWSKPEEKTVWRPEPIIEEPQLGCAADKKEDRNRPAVEELGRERVAGFDAVKLKARDVQALRDWLQEHNYDARPQLMDWVEPYVSQGWIITAFQIVKTDRKEESLSTQAVRMSFSADRPFFPYREPSDANEDGLSGRRLLRLFVVAGQRMQGELNTVKPWPGKAAWANPLTSEQHKTLGEQLGSRAELLPEKTWLTVFDDKTAPRPGGADLFFSPSEDQATLKRPPVLAYKTYYRPSSCDIASLLMLGFPLVLLLRAVIRSSRRRRTAV